MLQQSGLTALDFFEEMDENYEIDETGFPSNDSSKSEHFTNWFKLSKVHYRHLIATVNPLATSDNFGIDLFQ